MGTRHAIVVRPEPEQDYVVYPGSAGLAWTQDHLTLAFVYWQDHASAVSLDLEARQLAATSLGLAGYMFLDPFTVIAYDNWFAAAWVRWHIGDDKSLSISTSGSNVPDAGFAIYSRGFGAPTDYGASLTQLGESLVASATTQRSSSDIGQEEGPRCRYVVYGAAGELGSSSVLGACKGTHRLLGRSGHAVLVQAQSDGLKLARINEQGQLTTPLLKIAPPSAESASILDAGPGLAGVLWSDGDAGHFVLIDDTTLQALSNVVTFYASAGSRVANPLGVYSAGDLLAVFDRDGGADAIAAHCMASLPN
ncbi:MAG TPA: hypothetical protein VFQ61_05580 [Polyangiaceae bacterium]|nr:hypothetical protein [Polyangiaceae bacterium]